jgi:serine/threonine protein kinase
MGQVYRATDTRLGRTVAIKVIAAPTGAPELLLREARAASALNHPNICTVYDVVEHRGEPVLIMELLEGRSLEAIIADKLMPVEQALDLSGQIVDALDTAHEAGIVHGDVKPGNIFVTSRGLPKILDFGVAKLARSHESAAAEGPVEPRAPVGTPAYMSPEQTRAGPLDKRTDIWAFGVVLYEMLTGRRPFQRATTGETLAAIVQEEPDWDRVPERMQRLLRSCLEKDPKHRLRDIGDTRLLIDNARLQHASGRTLTRWIWPAAATLVLLTVGAFLGARYAENSHPRHPVRFEIQPPPGGRFDAPFVSPDGRSVAVFLYMPDGPGIPTVWLYSLQSNRPRLLFEPKLGTSRQLFWSPDSKAVVVFADRKLKKIDLATNSVQDLHDMTGFVGGGSWSRDDLILFSDNQRLWTVPAAGGTPVPVTTVDTSKESGHFFPKFLPDGRHFIYLRASATMETSGIYLGSLDDAPDRQRATRLAATRSGAVHVPSMDRGAGHLLFLRGSTLMAQPFDPRRLTAIGEPFSIDQPIGTDVSASNRYGYFSASETGVLAYVERRLSEGTVVWVDRKGNERGSAVEGPQQAPQEPRVSPDGNRLALVVDGDLWVYDQGKPPVRLTFDGGNDVPLWTPDGRRLVFARQMGLWSIAAHARDESPRVVWPEGHYHPHGWSSDGRGLIAVINTYDPRFSWDIMRLPSGGEGEAQPVVRSRFVEGMGGASLSPDGRWLAYTSTRTGTEEVWLQAFPGPGDPHRISTNGGTNPLWARNGRELYYLESDKIMAAAIDSGSRPISKPSRFLFKSSYLHRPSTTPFWDVAPDGRFVMIKPVEKQVPPPMTVIVDWTPRARR